MSNIPKCPCCHYPGFRSTPERRWEAQGRSGLLLAIEVVEEMKMTGEAPIGPLFGAGWNSATEAVLAAIRAALEED